MWKVLRTRDDNLAGLIVKDTKGREETFVVFAHIELVEKNYERA